MKIQVKENLSSAVKIGASRQVVIPKRIHDALGLQPGDYLQVELSKGVVIFKPKTLIDKKILEDVQASMEDIRNGRFSGTFDTADKAARSLHKAARTHQIKK